MKWVKVCDDAEMKSARRFVYAERAYALFRLPDGVYALDDVCSHEYSRLSEGEVWRGQVMCPKHGSRFDIKTGKVEGLPATRPVRTYPVKIEGGAVYVEIEEEDEW